MPAGVAIGALFATLSLGAAGLVDFGFDQARRPLDIGGPAPPAKECGECHEDAYAAWSKSRHRVSYSNRIFQVGFAAEPVQRCLNCHAPLRGASAEVAGTVTSVGLAAEGVTCAVCHVRDGEVLSARPSPDAPHPIRVAPGLSTGRLCEGCHQFNFHEQRGGVLTITDTPIQNTGAEWRQWRKAQPNDERATCNDCHMNRHDHLMPGAHDAQMLQSALRVEVRRRQGRSALVLTSKGVGHNLPSGDLFRHLRVEVRTSSATAWRQIAWIGRRYEAVEDPDTGRYSQALVSDTSLRPGVARTIEVDLLSFEYRVRYVFAGDKHLARVDDRSHLFSTLVQGVYP